LTVINKFKTTGFIFVQNDEFRTSNEKCMYFNSDNGKSPVHI
jgi:hypothetical protein